MRIFLVLVLACMNLPAQPSSLQVEPALATECNAAGRATLSLLWTARQPTQIRIATAEGTIQMTGDSPSSGTARTGPWVTDGMTFLLTTPAGQELARAQARVVCVTPSAASLLPLQRGYEWTYRTRNRAQTGETLTLRVTDAMESEGTVSFEVTATPGGVFGWFREDTEGRIWRRDRLGPASLWVDALTAPRIAFTGPLGEWPAAADVVQQLPLERTRRLFAPGVGQVFLESTLLTGSSGGFTNGWELVAYRLGNVVREEPEQSGLRLVAESRTLDVTGRQVSNCAVPCYFVACGLAPGADPPGAYKPCFRAHASGQSPTPGASLELRLLDAAGAVLYRAAQPLAAGSRLQRQVPIAHPPGRYSLEGLILAPAGDVEQRSVVDLDVH